MKKFPRNVAIVLLTLAGLALLWQFRSALVLVLLSILFAAAARPVVAQLVRGGLSRSLAMVMVYIVFIALLVGLFTAAGPRLMGELEGLTDRIVHGYRQVWEDWPNGTQIQQAIATQLPAPQEAFSLTSIDTSSPILSSILGLGSGLFGAIGQIFVAIVLSIYWTGDQVRFERLWLSVLPAEARTRARVIWREVENGLGQYIRSELLQSLLASVLLAIGFTLMDVPYATLLAVLGGVAWMIPWLGLLIVLILVISSASAISLGLAAAAGGYALIVLLALEIFVEPRVFERVRFSPLLMLLMVIALGGVFGVIGIVIGPPVAASIQLITRHLTHRAEQSLTEETVRQIVSLERHVELLQGKLNDENVQNPQQIGSILERLDHLVSQARELVEWEQQAGVLEPAGDHRTGGVSGEPG